jgi:hypothetical protein
VSILPAVLSSRSQSLGRRIFIAEAARPQPPHGLRNVRFCPLLTLRKSRRAAASCAANRLRSGTTGGGRECRPGASSGSRQSDPPSRPEP